MLSEDASMQTIRRDGVSIGYREQGAGPPVLLLHGAGLTHRLWEPQMSRLGTAYRCIAPDLRGHGATRVDAPADAYPVADHAADALALLDALGIDAAHLIGLSLGGLAAMEVAIAAPARVRSLVTIGAPAGIDSNAMLRAVLALSTRYLFRRMASGGMTWVAQTGARRMTRDPQVRTYMIEDCASNDAEEFKRVWRGLIAFDARARLGRVTTPTLAISGSKDRNLRGVRRAARLIPGARLEVIEGAGHITSRERPEEIGALLEAWLKDVSGERH